MEIIIVVGLAAILLVLVLLIYFSRHGLFSSVIIKEQNTGPFFLVYEKHVGDYKNVGPVMDEIYYRLKKVFSIETTKGFGLYYDNPREVDVEKLRSLVGCMVEEKDSEDWKKLKNEFNIKEYPSSKSIVAEFPYHGKMSIILGLFKVYPKLIKYISDKGYQATPIMEIYDQPNRKIVYLSSFNLSKDIFNSFLEVK